MTIGFNINKMTRLFAAVEKNCLEGTGDKVTGKDVVIAKVIHMFEEWNSFEEERYGYVDDKSICDRFIDVANKMKNKEICVHTELSKAEYKRIDKELKEEKESCHN